MRKTYGAGDFRSSECIDLLKEADIIVTNPPFSFLRKFIALLVGYNKKILILGNINAIRCKKIFPLFKDNKIWLGVSLRKGGVFFYSSYNKLSDHNQKKCFCNIRWFTNLTINYKQKPIALKEYYTPEKYPKYDNYDAINVDKVADIPCDYPGVMGVPLTFMDKYCPEQFRILGLTSGRKEFSREAWPTIRYVNPVQHNIDGLLKNGSGTNANATVFTKDTNSIYYTADNVNYKLKVKFIRILIKNKHPQSPRNAKR